MSEEETVFDPSLKKKKKKKKTYDLDAAMGVEKEAKLDGTTQDVTNNQTQDEADEAKDGIQDESLVELESFGKKKKKKTVKIDEGLNTVENIDGSTQSTLASNENVGLESLVKKKKKKSGAPLDMEELNDALPEMDDIGDDLDLESFGEKKKKKKKRGVMSLEDLGDAINEIESNENGDSADPWAQSDRDYTYDELLQRAFSIMRDKNPEMVAGEKKKFVMRPPQVVRVGTKKTAFVNFTEIAKMLHRQPKHLLAFLSAELGTVGAIDGNNQLIMKGRFQQKHLENILRRYIKEYVTCHTCRSPDTILDKETRLFFLQCNTCHSRCSVQSIKTGFQAVTSKRAAMRAKQ